MEDATECFYCGNLVVEEKKEEIKEEELKPVRTKVIIEAKERHFKINVFTLLGTVFILFWIFYYIYILLSAISFLK